MNISELMAELVKLFPKHFANQDNLDAWAAQYRAALGRLEPQELRAAFDATISQHTYQRAPLPAEFAKHVPEKHYTEQATTKPKGESWADRVMQLPEGQDALREGYARELYLWAGKNPGTVPNAIVMENCRRDELAFRAQLDEYKRYVQTAAPDKKRPNLGAYAMLAAATAGANGMAREKQLRNRFLTPQGAGHE